MDYEVLLLSRIRERYLATGDNTRAVAEGIGITGGIITGAALIMVAVFAAFGLSSITFIKALGLTMALAVLIDATVVRGLLVPAFMRVMGRVNWWAPRWVQRAVARLGLYEDVDDGPAARDAVQGNTRARDGGASLCRRDPRRTARRLTERWRARIPTGAASARRPARARGSGPRPDPASPALLSVP